MRSNLSEYIVYNEWFAEGCKLTQSNISFAKHFLRSVQLNATLTDLYGLFHYMY